MAMAEVARGLRVGLPSLPEIHLFQGLNLNRRNFKESLARTLNSFLDASTHLVVRFLEHRLTTGYVHYSRPHLKRYQPFQPREITVIHPQERESPCDSSGHLIFHNQDILL